MDIYEPGSSGNFGVAGQRSSGAAEKWNSAAVVQWYCGTGWNSGAGEKWSSQGMNHSG